MGFKGEGERGGDVLQAAQAGFLNKITKKGKKDRKKGIHNTPGQGEPDPGCPSGTSENGLCSFSDWGEQREGRGKQRGG